ncbi:MAG: EAL domain-containing protein, partial [Crocosphaera sp.]
LGLISAILAIGKGFNMRVVAEGVETSEQLKILEDLDCREIQGYWFSHPLPTKEATELLSKIARNNYIDSANFMSLPMIDS